MKTTFILANSKRINGIPMNRERVAKFCNPLFLYLYILFYETNSFPITF